MIPLPQPQPQPQPQPPPRVYVGSHEAHLLGTRAYLIDGEPITAAIVELPGVLCHCGDDEDGHPMVTSVVLESCGVDVTGREVFWDTGLIVDLAADVDAADAESGDEDEHRGWWLEVEEPES